MLNRNRRVLIAVSVAAVLAVGCQSQPDGRAEGPTAISVSTPESVQPSPDSDASASTDSASTDSATAASAESESESEAAATEAGVPATTEQSGRTTVPVPRQTGGLAAGTGSGGSGSSLQPGEPTSSFNPDSKFVMYSDDQDTPDDSSDDLVTCVGWDPRPDDDNTWTVDMRVGAEVILWDADIRAASDDPSEDAQLGSTQLLGGTAVNRASQDEREKWECEFAFAFDEVTLAENYVVTIGRHGPWPLVPDSTVEGGYFFPVDVGRPEPAGCATQNLDGFDSAFPVSGFALDGLVGGYWTDALSSICGNGLVIAAIDEVCIPANYSPDRLVAIRSSTDPDEIYADLAGVTNFDLELPIGTPVAVDISLGPRCE